jgi:hypothetical protein
VRQSPDRKLFVFAQDDLAKLYRKMLDRCSHLLTLGPAQVIGMRILRRIGWFAPVVSVRIEVDLLRGRMSMPQLV